MIKIRVLKFIESIILMTTTDLYAVLGVPRHASRNVIKQAYKALAMKFHPDKNHENPEKANEIFQRISEAYGTLIDEKDRKKYDLSLEHHEQTKVFRRTTPMKSDFDDLYERFYGKNGFCNKHNNSSNFTRLNEHEFDNHNPSRPPPIPKNQGISELPPNAKNAHSRSRTSYTSNSASCTDDSEIDMEYDDIVENLVGDINVPVYCSLEDIFNCSQKTYIINRYVDGEIDQKKCVVTLTKGIPDGKKIVIKGLGNKKQDEEPHDVIFTIRQLRHPTFIRGDNGDIFENYYVPLKKALLGFTLSVKGIDGEDIEAEIRGPIHEDYRKVFRNKGLHIENTDMRGDHIVMIHVILPRTLTEEQREYIEKGLPD